MTKMRVYLATREEKNNFGMFCRLGDCRAFLQVSAC